MQLKARCKHTFWWRRLHEYFMSQIRRQSRRGTHCMMHVYVGVTACLYLSLSLCLSLPPCVCVAEHGNQKCRTTHGCTWGAVPFECQRQLPRILDASSSVLNGSVGSKEHMKQAGMQLHWGRDGGGIWQNVRALCMSINWVTQSWTKARAHSFNSSNGK